MRLTLFGTSYKNLVQDMGLKLGFRVFRVQINSGLADVGYRIVV